MKENNITIDINKLDTDKLQILMEICYKERNINDWKKVDERLAFLNGWMNDEQEKKHIEKYC